MNGYHVVATFLIENGQECQQVLTYKRFPDEQSAMMHEKRMNSDPKMTSDPRHVRFTLVRVD